MKTKCWWLVLFSYSKQQDEELKMEYSSDELFIHFPTTVSPCCFFIPREIRDVVSNQDIRVLKILSIPAGDWKLLVAFVCLYLESSSEKFLFCSLMRWRDMEGGIFGGSSMFKKLDQNSVSVKKKISLIKEVELSDIAILTLGTHGPSFWLLVKIIPHPIDPHMVKLISDWKLMEGEYDLKFFWYPLFDSGYLTESQLRSPKEICSQ